MGKSTNPAGITAIDVARLLAQIGEEHVGHTVVELRIAPVRFGSSFVRLVVVAANYVGIARTARNTRAAVQASFPSNKYKTLNGCIFGLLYELEAELEQMRATSRGPQAEEEHDQMRLV